MVEIFPEIVEFYAARLDELEWWAREASCAGDRRTPEGVRWQWVDQKDDSVLSVDPLDPYPLSGSLRSVERYKSHTPFHSYTLPQFAIHTVEEVPMCVAGHILRHDPASVMARVKAGRELVDHVHTAWADAKAQEPKTYKEHIMRTRGDMLRAEHAKSMAIGLTEAVRALAGEWEAHPDYQPEWTR